MRTIILSGLLWLVFSFIPTYADIKVVASIKPVHSLVAAVMEGAGEPYLVVKSSGSPHTYNMKPSDAKAIQGADLVFLIGAGLETFLQRPLKNLSDDRKVVELWKSKRVKTLPYRNGREWSRHSHDHHDHHTKVPDMHIWLSPANAKAMVDEISDRLIAADRKNAGIYEVNRGKLLARLDELESKMKKQLSPVSKKPFIVFHDSYQYLESAMDLSAAGSVTVNPEAQLGARHLSSLRKYIAKYNIRCLFSEPQFNAAMINTLASSLKAETAILDPMGANIPDGPDLYFRMMEGNANALVSCLK